MHVKIKVLGCDKVFWFNKIVTLLNCQVFRDLKKVYSFLKIFYKLDDLN